MPLGLPAGLPLLYNKGRCGTAQGQSARHAAALEAQPQRAGRPAAHARALDRLVGYGPPRADTHAHCAGRPPRRYARTHTRTHDARAGPGRGPGRGAQAAAEAAGRRPLGPCPAGTFIHL